MNSNPTYEALALVNTFIDLEGGVEASNISPMKMQKLIFFAHGWYLANYKVPLVQEPIQAWQFGPVIESLYHDLKEYGSDRIESYLTKLSFDSGIFQSVTPKVEDQEVISFLSEVLKVYGQYTAVQLSNLSHEPGAPWDLVRMESGGNLEKRSIPIPNSLIGDFYTTKMNQDV